MWKENFSHPVAVTGSMHFGIIFQIMCISRIKAKTKKNIRIIQVVSKLTILLTLQTNPIHYVHALLKLKAQLNFLYAAKIIPISI